MLTKIHEIELEILEELLDDIKGMHPEYIVDYIKYRIGIIKHGV